MKKLYVLGLVLTLASVAGCTLKAPKVLVVSTGDVVMTGTVELTGVVENTGTTSSAMEEFTGEIDSGVVPTVAGSNEVTAEQSGVVTEVKDLINERQTQPKDDTKLTEEDIGLMEQIIQKVQDLGK